MRSLDDREREILFGRTLRLEERLSYRKLGEVVGLSFERVRLIELATVNKLRAGIATASMGIVRRDAEWLRSELGKAAPVNDADSILGLASEDLRLDEGIGRPTNALLRLWIAGPYDLIDGWLITSPAKELLRRAEVACRGATTDGPVKTDRCNEVISALGVRRIWTKRFFELLDGFRVLDGYVVLWTGTLADKLAAVLQVRGEPMSKVELANAVGEGSAGTLVNYLGWDPRFVRAGKGVYGLKEWGFGEYEGIVSTMLAELDRHGGLASLEELREAVRGVGASPNSVAFYTGGLLFVEEDGKYRRRTKAELADVRPGPAVDAAGCFRGHEGWMFLHVVSGETLRGSGLHVPTRFCEAIGVTGANREATFTSAYGPISFQLTDQANLTVSSLRRPAAQLGCTVGDHLFVECGDTTVAVRAVRRADLDTMTPGEKAVAEIGTSLERWDGDLIREFWWALGFSRDSAPDIDQIRAKLLARNEKELLRLFDLAIVAASSD
jgi:hypothetical protein